MSRLRPDHFEYVRTMVRQRSGIVLEDGKEYLVETRLSALARTRETDLHDLVEEARRSPHAAVNDDIVDAMTTNETSFFRDIHPFNSLRDEIIPRLLEARSGVRTLRILSGASSTGQEAYSLAMMLRTSFPELTGWRVEIVGTVAELTAQDKAFGTDDGLTLNGDPIGPIPPPAS